MERSTELRDRALDGFEAFSGGDASLVDRDTSRHEGVRLIGTDPEEWFEGERVAEVLKQEVQDTAGEWKMVQAHTSAGVPKNEELFGEELFGEELFGG